MDKHNSKLARWSCQLSEHAFDFVWKSGECMIEPYTLSRAALPASSDEPTLLSTPLATNLQDACQKMLATSRPANATPMSAEKARVVAIEWRTKQTQRGQTLDLVLKRVMARAGYSIAPSEASPAYIRPRMDAPGGRPVAYLAAIPTFLAAKSRQSGR
jgi:hypothetical protein